MGGEADLPDVIATIFVKAEAKGSVWPVDQQADVAPQAIARSSMQAHGQQKQNNKDEKVCAHICQSNKKVKSVSLIFCMVLSTSGMLYRRFDRVFHKGWRSMALVLVGRVG